MWHHSCATSDVDPIVKLDPSGRVVASLGAGQIIWPHGMDVDAEGNIGLLMRAWQMSVNFRPTPLRAITVARY